jgi:hypothetical protein
MKKLLFITSLFFISCNYTSKKDFEDLKKYEDSINIKNKVIEKKYPTILDYKAIKQFDLQKAILKFGNPISKKISNDCSIEEKCMIVKFPNNINAEFTEHGEILLSIEIYPKQNYEFDRSMTNLISGWDLYKDIINQTDILLLENPNGYRVSFIAKKKNTKYLDYIFIQY